MRYRNLVYCKHPNFTKRAYLYELPMELSVVKGERICVKDRRGEHIVTAFCDNWVCSDHMAKVLCEANGGYFPPAQVIGTVRTITVRQDIVDKFPEKFSVKEEEEQPWF